MKYLSTAILKFRDSDAIMTIGMAMSILTTILLIIGYIWLCVMNLWLLLLAPIIAFGLYCFFEYMFIVSDQTDAAIVFINVYDDLYELRREHTKLLKKYNKMMKLKYAKVL